jgi:hypothetical protein
MLARMQLLLQMRSRTTEILHTHIKNEEKEINVEGIVGGRG